MDGVVGSRPVLVRHLVTALAPERRGGWGEISCVWALTGAALPRLASDALRPVTGLGLPEGTCFGSGRLWRPLPPDGAKTGEAVAVRMLEVGPGCFLPPPEIQESPLAHPYAGEGPAPADHAADLVAPEWLLPGRAAVRAFVTERLCLCRDAAYVRLPLPRLDGTGWGYPTYAPGYRDLAFDRTCCSRVEDHARYVARVAGAERAAGFLREGRLPDLRDAAGHSVEAEPCARWLALSLQQVAGAAFRAARSARLAGLADVPGPREGRMPALARHLARMQVHALPESEIGAAADDAHAVLAAVRAARPRTAARIEPMLAYIEEVARPAARAALPVEDAADLGRLAP